MLDILPVARNELHPDTKPSPDSPVCGSAVTSLIFYGCAGGTVRPCRYARSLAPLPRFLILAAQPSDVHILIWAAVVSHGIVPYCLHAVLVCSYISHIANIWFLEPCVIFTNKAVRHSLLVGLVSGPYAYSRSVTDIGMFCYSIKQQTKPRTAHSFQVRLLGHSARNCESDRGEGWSGRENGVKHKC
jgi:hypothetical protein